MKKTVCALVSLFLLLSAAGCGASESAPSPRETSGPETAEISPAPETYKEAGDLTADEIDWFNTAFFNGTGVNIHNQFLTSEYSDPAGIDLHQLFYTGSGADEAATDEERAAVLAANGWEDPEIDCVKNSTAAMNAVLTANMGITLDETDGVGLGVMTYLPKYDAYYSFQGDTNYTEVVIDSGCRDGAGNVGLYYKNGLLYGTPMVLTLREKDGGYLFVSNTADDNTADEAADDTAPAGLSPDDSLGIGVLIDYADDHIVVFHGWFGLFVYSIDDQKITSAVDFNKTVGVSDIQGSVIASVDVSADGSAVEIHLVGAEEDMKEMGLDPDAAWMLDTGSGALTKGTYQPLADPFDNYADNENAGAFASLNEIPFPDGAACMASDGMTLGGLQYVRGSLVLPVFQGYF